MHLRLIGLVIAVALGGCAKRVEFATSASQPPPAATTQLFIDAHGNLYPAEGIPPDGFRVAKHDGSLLNLFRDTKNGPCKVIDPATQAGELCRAALQSACDDTRYCAPECEIPSGCQPVPWQAAQNKLWRSAAQRVVRAASGTGDIPIIVFLVHGFNNSVDRARETYDAVAEDILSASDTPASIHFVEVFWDGCSTNRAGIGCWGRAQASGPLAGFSMREMFNAIEEEWPQDGQKPALRILTHSSGAFVIGATFGDPTVTLPLLRDPARNLRYARFAEHRRDRTGSRRLPQPSNLRVGMLVAATPPQTFTGHDMFLEAGWLTQNSQLLVSVLPTDRGPQKVIGACSRIGYSCLGVKKSDACLLRSSSRLANREVKVLLYDFDRSAWEANRKAHDFTVYTDQAREGSTFQRDLLQIGAVDDAEPPIDC